MPGRVRRALGLLPPSVGRPLGSLIECSSETVAWLASIGLCALVLDVPLYAVIDFACRTICVSAQGLDSSDVRLVLALFQVVFAISMGLVAAVTWVWRRIAGMGPMDDDDTDIIMRVICSILLLLLLAQICPAVAGYLPSCLGIDLARAQLMM